MAETKKAAAAAEADPTKPFEKDGVVQYASTPAQEVNLRAQGYQEKTSKS